MKKKEMILRGKIIHSLKDQGFSVNGKVSPKRTTKNTLKKLHKLKREEQLKKHKKFLLNNFHLAKQFSLNGKELDPSKIDLELREVKPNSQESKLFFWWNLGWWSLPYDCPIGRQMRFVMWDKYHNTLFGLIGLQSPPLTSSIRDNFLGLTNGKKEKWINQSMYGQRLGALPPYNDLLGGKIISLSLISNEIRKAYKKKYRGRTSLMDKKKIPARLLFITTTSAFGKSSVYERINYEGKLQGIFLGYTSGAGTFHLPENLYYELLEILKKNEIDSKRGYGTGPSRKLKLVSKGFKLLGLSGVSQSYVFHNIKRGYYIFPLVENLNEVLHKKRKPQWKDYSFNELFFYWKKRWCIPRSKRILDWKNFNADNFFKRFEKYLNKLN